MGRHKPGTRVGAISHGDDDTIYLFGYGEYVGDEIPETAGGWMGSALCEAQQSNPKIVLDNGDVVGVASAGGELKHR